MPDNPDNSIIELSDHYLILFHYLATIWFWVLPLSGFLLVIIWPLSGIIWHYLVAFWGAQFGYDRCACVIIFVHKATRQTPVWHNVPDKTRAALRIAAQSSGRRVNSSTSFHLIPGRRATLLHLISSHRINLIEGGLEDRAHNPWLHSMRSALSATARLIENKLESVAEKLRRPAGA